jgi:hypothetical protein
MIEEFVGLYQHPVYDPALCLTLPPYHIIRAVRWTDHQAGNSSTPACGYPRCSRGVWGLLKSLVKVHLAFYNFNCIA